MRSPSRAARLFALLLICGSALINVGLGFNAVVKANKLNNKIPSTIARIISFSDHDRKAPIGITINNQDIVQTGAAVTYISALIALSCTLVTSFHLRGPPSLPALRRQGAFLALCSSLLFAALAPYTLVYRSRSANVAVSVFSAQIPENIVQIAQNVLGIKSKYSQVDFLRLMAILPWFTVLLLVITAAMFLVSV